MAAIARTIKNLLSSLSGENTAASIPAETAAVVIIDAPTKNNIKKGNIFLILTFAVPSVFLADRALMKARTRVMGMMASVLVSLTVTAVSRVADPSP